jgi:flagellar motor switch protein FliM
MPEILSQQEIDNLLSGLGGSPAAMAKTEAAAKRTEKEILTFDFRLPNRLSKNQLKTLQAVHENFAEAFASYLVSRLQTTVTIDVTSVDQLFYSEYVLSIASPSCLYIFRVVESDALAILELSPMLVLACVARMLGGPHEEEMKPRNITRIEQSIVRGLILRAMTDLQNSWKVISPLTFSLERFESEGDFAQVAPTSEIVLVICFEVRIGEKKFLMNLCFPTFALEDVLAKLTSQHFSHSTNIKFSEEWAKNLQKQLEKTTISATAVLGSTEMSLKELIDLEVGDVLKTHIPISTECQVVIGDKPRLWGSPGISNGKKALKITKFNSDMHQGE